MIDSTRIPAVRQVPMPQLFEESPLSQEEKILAVLAYISTDRPNGKPSLLVKFASYWTGEADDPDADAKEVAHDALAEMLRESKMAEVEPLSGEVELDLQIMKNWIFKFLEHKWRQLRDKNQSEKIHRKTLERREAQADRDDFGSYHTPIRGSHADDNPDDKGPTTLPTEPPQVTRQPVERPEAQDSPTPKGTPVKKQKLAKPRKGEARQSVRVKGGRTSHRWREDRRIARVAREHDRRKLERWPHTCKALFVNAHQGTTRAAETYGLARKTFSDWIAKSLAAMQAYVAAWGTDGAPVDQGPEVKALDAIERGWVELSEKRQVRALRPAI